MSEIESMLLKDLVVRNFNYADVFEFYGIDYCCNGNRRVGQALSEKGIDIKSFKKKVREMESGEINENIRAEEWGLDILSQYIVNNHHSYVRSALPRINELLQKVIAAHSESHKYIAEVRDIFANVTEEMTSHMMKEERIVFPIIKYLVESEKFNERPRTSGFGTIQNPINRMEFEHESAGNSMRKIRELTNNYNIPDDACPSFQMLYNELDFFEKDLHKHIHLENNILFPGSIQLESRLVKKKQ